MPDPVLRIPIDDAAFKRYLAAFQRYQEQLREQPDMWEHANEAVLDGVAANLSLADAIGQSVSAALRLGNVEERNAQRRRKDAQDEDAEQQRSSSWRRKALDHVQELSRTSASIVRGFGSFASGANGTGGLFSGISDIGKGLGGTLGGLVNLAGHVLNAGYEVNNAVSDKGLFARGIGTSISGQEGFQNNLGRYTNTDQGIDAVMNARGSPDQWWQFNALGVDRTKGSNTDVYGNVLRSQAALAKRFTDANGVTNWAQVDPRGGSAFGTTHEDLNRLKGLSGTALDKAIQTAVSFKSPLGDKQTDAATKSVVAMDNLTTRVRDSAQAMAVGFDPALDKATKGLTDLAAVAEKIVSLFPSNWNLNDATPTIHHESDADRKRAEADPNNPRGKGLWGGLKAMWNSPWISIDTPGGGGHSAYAPGGGGRSFKGNVADLTSSLEQRGIGATAATGSAGGIIAEGGGLGMSKNGAFGIGQWRGDRLKKLFAKYGPNPSLDQQLDFLASELKGGDYGGKSVLGASSVSAALSAYAYKFMRPNNFAKDPHDYAADDVRRGTHALTTAGVNVKVAVTLPTGAQAAVTANSTGKS